MYDVRPNTIIGFHGCDLDIRTKLVNHPNQIEISKKPYDWLGHGMYCWENNYTRAMEWAEARAADGSFKKPAVLGTVLQLDSVLNSKYFLILCYSRRLYVSLIRAVHFCNGCSNYFVSLLPLFVR